MILFWENGPFFRSAWIFSNRAILCPLFSQLSSSPTGATALFPVGQKAEPRIVTQTSWFIDRVSERNSNLDAWLGHYYILWKSSSFSPVPFPSLRQFPSVSLGCRWKPVCEWACRRMGARGRRRCTCVPSAQPRPVATPLALRYAFCRVAHFCTRKEFLRKSLHMHHLAIFCTDRRRDLRVLQHKWRTSERWPAHAC